MDRRAKFRQGLSTLYLPYYDALCGLINPLWQPFYGLRTMDEQTALWNQGRSTPGPMCRCAGQPTLIGLCSKHPFGLTVTNAAAGYSPHNYGCASDWTIFDVLGRPVWMESSDDRWKDYEQALEKVGLTWGGHFGSLPDRPHNELTISCSWSHVAAILGSQGMVPAQQKIEGAHAK